MESAITAVVDMDDRRVILAVSFNQLCARSKGDLITAEIIEIEPVLEDRDG